MDREPSIDHVSRSSGHFYTPGVGERARILGDAMRREDKALQIEWFSTSVWVLSVRWEVLVVLDVFREGGSGSSTLHDECD